ncbi:hypothetical protein SAMN04489760_1662, partial [Syntrophus gentianae]
SREGCIRWAIYRQSQQPLTPPKGRGFSRINKKTADCRSYVERVLVVPLLLIVLLVSCEVNKSGPSNAFLNACKAADILIQAKNIDKFKGTQLWLKDYISAKTLDEIYRAGQSFRMISTSELEESWVECFSKDFETSTMQLKVIEQTRDIAHLECTQVILGKEEKNRIKMVKEDGYWKFREFE